MMQPSFENRYDIFISYRSKNIHIVRPVAEYLMACGLKVWFAEYEILLSGRDYWEKAVRRGITNCSYGVCFTNDDYVQSEDCRMELQLLIETLGPNKIVEVCYPRQLQIYYQFPALQKAHSFEYQNLVQTMRDIHSVTGYDIQLSLDESQTPTYWHRLSSNGLKYQLDFGGWDIKIHRFKWAGGGDRRVATYHRSGKRTFLYGHLIVGPMDVCRKSLSVEGEGDDRDYYDRAIHLADSFYYGNIRQVPIGVHLSFIPEPISQASFTTQFAPGVISRLYSVVLESPKNRNDIEFVFFFFYRGKIGDFWRQAHLMDRLVQSLQVENKLTKNTVENRKARHKIVQGVSRKLPAERSSFFLFSKWRSVQLRKDVLRGDIQRVRALLNRGANPNITMISGCDAKGGKIFGAPLMAAASEGLEEIVIELLAYGAQVNYTDSRGWTALLFATENGYKKICELLLNSGADPNIKTANSGTALMCAALKGHAEIVQLLLERGANVSVRDSSGKSALDFAYKYGRSEVISILKDKSSE